MLHVQYKIVIPVINIIISYFSVMDGNLMFRHIYIGGSALILHLPRTFSYNDNIFLDDPTKYVILLLIADESPTLYWFYYYF